MKRRRNMDESSKWAMNLVNVTNPTGIQGAVVMTPHRAARIVDILIAEQDKELAKFLGHRYAKSCDSGNSEDADDLDRFYCTETYYKDIQEFRKQEERLSSNDK